MTSTLREVLIVEDDPDIRVLIRVHLVNDPRLAVTGEASSAAEAIDAARSLRPDIIVLDHTIKGTTMGIEAAPLLREVAPNAKILLFSAFDLAERAAAEPAIDAYLKKTEIVRLLTAVRVLLGLDDP